MKNLNQYFNKTRIENSPREADFSMLLNNISTKTELRSNFYTNTNRYVEKVKSPFFGWSFGFAGFAVAAFMIFINSNIYGKVENLALGDSVVKNSNNTTVEKKSVSDTINLIDSIESFNSAPVVIKTNKI